MAVFCKTSQTWMLTGDNPETFRVFELSDRTGRVAGGSMAVGTLEVQSGFYRRVAVWLSQEGVVACDGNAPIVISDDLYPLFDPQSSMYLSAATLALCNGFIDPVRSEYHLVIPNVNEYVYDFKKKKWFEVSRGTGNELECGCAVYDANGVAYGYGAVDDGKVYRLENGTTFNGTAISCEVTTADLALENGSVTVPTSVMGTRLYGKAKTGASTVTLTHYGDSATSGNAFATISPVAFGKRLFDVRRMERISGPCMFHQFKMTTSVSDETIPFEPLFFAVYYEPSTNL